MYRCEVTGERARIRIAPVTFESATTENYFKGKVFNADEVIIDGDDVWLCWELPGPTEVQMIEGLPVTVDELYTAAVYNNEEFVKYTEITEPEEITNVEFIAQNGEFVRIEVLYPDGRVVLFEPVE